MIHLEPVGKSSLAENAQLLANVVLWKAYGFVTCMTAGLIGLQRSAEAARF